MKVKNKCKHCGRVSYLTGLVNDRKKITKFKKGFKNLLPCIHCDYERANQFNEAIELIGGKARFKEK